MKNNFKNVIVLGELDYVLSANFEDKGKATVLEYSPKLLPLTQSDNGATVVNCLHVVNNTLEKIVEIKNANNGLLEETCYITIPDKLYKAIQRGTYKNWIKNDGVANTGYAYDEKEINEWVRFTSLYSHLFLDINFRNVTYYGMSNPRYDIDNVNRHKYLIKKMRERIEYSRQKALDMILFNH